MKTPQQKFILKMLRKKVIKEIKDHQIIFNEPYTQYYLDRQIFKLYTRLHNLKFTIKDINLSVFCKNIYNQLQTIQHIINTHEKSIEEPYCQQVCLNITGKTITALMMYINKQHTFSLDLSTYNPMDYWKSEQ